MNAMNPSALTVADLDASYSDEPRILDLRIAERLGYVRPRKVREIIEANKAELETYGSLAPTRGKSRGQEFTEYHLNEGQILLICMYSRTANAATVRREVIEVFIAYRRGLLSSPEPQPAAAPAPQDTAALGQFVREVVEPAARLFGPEAAAQVWNAPASPLPGFTVAAPAPVPSMVPVAAMPRPAAARDVQAVVIAAGSFRMWWGSLLIRGEIVTGQGWPSDASVEALYAGYRAYATAAGDHRLFCREQFGRALALVMPAGFRAGQKVRVDGVRRNGYPDPRGRRWPLDLLAIDNGYRTKEVNQWVARHPGRVMAIKGDSGNESAPYVKKGSKLFTTVSGRRVGIDQWIAGTYPLTRDIYDYLALPPGESEDFPVGYCHFPEAYVTRPADEAHFRQLTAEELKIARDGGRHFECPSGVRNEVLDCRKYALAAAHRLGIPP